MAERTLRARGRQRREALLRAALAVIGERGIGGLTHRAVAAAAGVPVATTTYYFGSIDELLEAALELYVEEEIARLEAVSEQVVAFAGSADEILLALAAELAGGDSSVAQFELYLEVSRRPALQPVVTRALSAYRSLAEGLLRHVGHPDPSGLAPVVVSLVDGMGVHQIAQPVPDREAQIVEGLRALLGPWLGEARAAAATSEI
jgi:TetR/AcrR family transcriptional regulator, regulator of biofilm formation and stress response